ncbi:MAG: helix-turn-helix domain-containing protein [Opitutales bacterium]|nr:helix-turn-helix domain-containing protein [Opitutales bacterium]
MAAPTETTTGGRLFDFRILRSLRKGAGLTIGAVSVQSGVSPAVISKLERNQTTAELETLYRLARVFQMSATDLLALAESPFAQQAGERVYEREGFRFRIVRYANMACFLAEARAGAQVSNPEIHRDDHEFCWVLHGRVRISLPAEKIELGGGESAQFDAVLEHTYEALEDSRLILVHTRKNQRYGSNRNHADR